MKRKNTLKSKTKVAILSASLNAGGDGWHKLLPAGKFKARDGRPFDTKEGYWFIDENIAQQFIAQTLQECKGQKILIDYDHQTLHRDETGQKALAAGWIVDPANDITWRTDGLYIRPRWTPVTQTEIDNEQWGSFSAVFPYDENGHPLYLRMAAITNDPGLVEIQSLVALAADLFNENQPITLTQETNMNELLKMILIRLGLISEDDDISITDENAAEYTELAASAIDSLKAAGEAVIEVKETIADESSPDVIVDQVQETIEANSDEIAETERLISEAELSGVDLGKYVPATLYKGALRQVAALSSNNVQLTADQIINNARNKGQILASEVPYYRGLARQKGVAELSAIIKGRKPIAALTRRQTHTVDAQKQNTDAVLSAADLRVIEATGISKADYLKTKKGMK